MDNDIKKDLAIGIAAMIFVVVTATILYSNKSWVRGFEPIRVYPPQHLIFGTLELSDNVEDRRCVTGAEVNAQLLFRKSLVST